MLERVSRVRSAARYAPSERLGRMRNGTAFQIPRVIGS